MRYTRGFTLIELIVTIAIMAIIVSWAMPTWQKSIQGAQVDSDSRGFAQALMLARSEAVTRGTDASVCPLNSSKPNTGCGDNWQQGWVVYIGNDNSFAASDRLRVHEETRAQQITGNAGPITFNARGMLTDASSTDRWKFCSDKCTAFVEARKSGRVSLKKIGSSG